MESSAETLYEQSDSLSRTTSSSSDATEPRDDADVSFVTWQRYKGQQKYFIKFCQMNGIAFAMTSVKVPGGGNNVVVYPDYIGEALWDQCRVVQEIMQPFLAHLRDLCENVQKEHAKFAISYVKHISNWPLKRTKQPVITAHDIAAYGDMKGLTKQLQQIQHTAQRKRRIGSEARRHGASLLCARPSRTTRPEGRVPGQAGALAAHGADGIRRLGSCS